MDEFTGRLELTDKEKIRDYLLSLKSPCYESTLLRIIFPEMNILNENPLKLYQNHFILFHLLYRLQDEFYKENKYLFVHFMRIFLLDYPEPGKCRFYEELSGRFCNVPCNLNKNYCDFHFKKLGDTELEMLSVKYFYLDAENFYNLDEESAAAFIKGTWELLSNYKSYQKSFEILGIPETSDIWIIKKRFRILAGKYHPDHGATSHMKFNEINNAYRLLLKLIPIFKTSL